MGFDGFVREAGFMDYLSRDNYPAFSDSVYDGAWGICDEPFFLFAARRMNEHRTPFCDVIFSLSSHDPCTIPKHRKKLFDAFNQESDFERALRYSDFSLQQYFQYAKNQSWFENTLFIITADHTYYGTRNNFYDTFHIPLLIFAPKILQPQRIEGIGSHVDILPTIIDILRFGTVHASIGTSLLDTTKQHYAVVKYGPYFVIFENRYIFMSKLDNDKELYEYAKPLPECNANIVDQFPLLADSLKDKLYSYLQCVTNALANNKVYIDTRKK